MAIYTVHLGPGEPRSALSENAALAPEAFSWAAFLLGPIWLAAHRLWLALACWAVAVGSLLALAIAIPQAVDGLSIAASLVAAEVYLGLEANGLRRRKLERAGRPAVDVVAADSHLEAERAFFQRGRSDQEPADRLSPRSPPQGGEPAFLALFPDEPAS